MEEKLGNIYVKEGSKGNQAKYQGYGLISTFDIAEKATELICPKQILPYS